MAVPRDGELETAVEMSAALAKGEVTAAELAERSMRRVEAWQPVANAFSQVWEEAAGAPSGARLVPLAIKDLYDVAGRETTGCCAAYRGNVARQDAVVIARLRERFAFIGKTNQHELAAGGTNLVSACGRTGNPWDPARMTGGSSGGSGAAIAAGIVPVALGSDTGGSIRIPAAMCGTFGLKPSTGRLPIQGLMPLAPSMDCPGPMAAIAQDLQFLFEAMTGSRQRPVPKPQGAYRIALADGFFADVVDREVETAVTATAEVFLEAGLAVETVDGTGVGDARSTWMDVCCPEFAEAHVVLKDPERWRVVSDQPREWLERGGRTSREQREAAAARRAEIGGWYRDRLAGFDALLIPTTPYPAPRADADRVDLGGDRAVEIAKVGPGYITSSVNLAGLPALNLPAGRSSEGMPIGVSLVGHDDAEDVLIRLAQLWEDASGYRPVRPPQPVP
jgi:Asp-tRNA(Asn)/Glu-tRNA(Gln) amidotransferase A subunit family amidase